MIIRNIIGGSIMETVYRSSTYSDYLTIKRIQGDLRHALRRVAQCKAFITRRVIDSARNRWAGLLLYKSGQTVIGKYPCTENGNQTAQLPKSNNSHSGHGGRIV